MIRNDLPPEGSDLVQRDAEALRARAWTGWQKRRTSERGLWVFGYGSLIWRPDFNYQQRQAARVYGWHRALAMWSQINRGTPQRPGLVFAMLPGGSCRGFVFQVPEPDADEVFERLWAREMPDPVYDPNWLSCYTPQGQVEALAFTLSRRSPAYTGHLTPGQYRQIFEQAQGRYGSTLDYARQTLDSLRAHGIRDQRLAQLLSYAPHD